MTVLSRREFLTGLAGMSCMLLGAPLARAATPSSNIVFFLADDFRYDALGFLRRSSVQTPALDALARRSLVFSNAFVTTSVCPVSRASILTGLTMPYHQVRSFRAPLSKRLYSQSFPSLLRARGYHTGFIGKWGIGKKAPSNFDYWDGYLGQGEGNDERIDEMLIDLELDPLERQNLVNSSDHQRILSEYRAKTARYREQSTLSFS